MSPGIRMGSISLSGGTTAAFVAAISIARGLPPHCEAVALLSLGGGYRLQADRSRL